LHNASLPEGSKGLSRFERHVFGVLSEREFNEYARVMRTQLQDLCDRAESGLELAADKKGRKRKACGLAFLSSATISNFVTTRGAPVPPP